MRRDLNTELEQKSIYERRATFAIKNFIRRNINAHYVPNKEEALNMVIEMIPEEATVGTADSVTILQVGVLSELKKRGRNKIINPYLRNEEGYFVSDEEERTKLSQKSILCIKSIQFLR